MSEWTTLLAWLRSIEGTFCSDEIEMIATSAGRGLFLKRSLPSNTRLITLSPASLLNMDTLAPLYPSAFESLSATQWISLHLALQLNRNQIPPAGSTHLQLDFFAPFLASLPKAFRTVPLSWVIQSQSPEQLRLGYNLKSAPPAISTQGQASSLRLVKLMPPSVARRTDAIVERFRADWRRSESVYSESNLNDSHGELDFFHYLISWTNVNTRCVYHQMVERIPEDNITLAPVLDMLNHATNNQTTPIITNNCLTFSTPEKYSSDVIPQAGAELTFSYGPHENPMLMAEYGFVSNEENPYDSVSINSQVEALFAAQGRVGEMKESLLKEHSYWGDSTIQSSPPEASWRVLMQLRLLHLHLDVTDEINLITKGWLDVVSGEEEMISQENENETNQSIVTICRAMIAGHEKGVRDCELAAAAEVENGATADERASRAMLELIWRGELETLLAMIPR